MFYSEHNPPHFHAYYNEYKAEIEIHTLEILAEKLPKKVYNLIVEWALEHKVELKVDWDLLSDDKEPKKIEPLT